MCVWSGVATLRFWVAPLLALQLRHVLDVGGDGLQQHEEDADAHDDLDRRHLRPPQRGADLVVLQGVLGARDAAAEQHDRSEEHTSELQSLMRNSYAVFCLKTKD